jgi:Ni,Fe-hydrogenase III component G
MYNQSLEKLKSIFAKEIEAGSVSIFEKNHKRVYVTFADKTKAVEAVKFLFTDQELRFSTITGVDQRDHIELIYHMPDDKANAVINIRTTAEKPFPVIMSVTPSVPAAHWVEREIHEMLGVEFTGHPDPKKLLLPDDWPEGVYPLRKGQ